jgi:hypothetical protein
MVGDERKLLLLRRLSDHGSEGNWGECTAEGDTNSHLGRGTAVEGSTADWKSTGCIAIHSLDPEDAAITTAMRASASSRKGARAGVEAREQFGALMESISPRGGVRFEADTLGGVPGLWVHPAHLRSGGVIVHLHGGWFKEHYLSRRKWRRP